MFSKLVGGASGWGGRGRRGRCKNLSGCCGETIDQSLASGKQQYFNERLLGQRKEGEKKEKNKETKDGGKVGRRREREGAVKVKAVENGGEGVRAGEKKTRDKMYMEKSE